MPETSTLNVTVPPELDQFIRERIAAGRNRTASDVVAEGLNLLQQQELDLESALIDLKAKLARGAAQADRGEFVDPKEVLANIEKLKKERATRRV